MLKKLLKHAKSLARDLNLKTIVVVSREEPKADDRFNIVAVSKKFVTMLESMLFSIEREMEIGKDILERSLVILQAREYIPTFLYFKDINLDQKVICVIDLELFKGLVLIDLKDSKIKRALTECSERINPNVLKAILNIAIDIARKGREGRRIGTAFVIGDVEEVLRRSRQLILNPYEGHPIDERDITNPENWESIKEFAQLDGVFIVDERGVIVAAGRYLEVSGKDVKMKKGFGGRHLACASITRETEAIAVVVSESGGDVRIYKDGEEILVIDSDMIL